MDIAPVPESLSKSIRTSSAGRRNRLYCAASRSCSRCLRVVQRMGSTLLMRKGSMMVLTGMATASRLELEPLMLRRICDPACDLSHVASCAPSQRNYLNVKNPTLIRRKRERRWGNRATGQPQAAVPHISRPSGSRRGRGDSRRSCSPRGIRVRSLRGIRVCSGPCHPSSARNRGSLPSRRS